MNIIINADDCGYSKYVNQRIEEEIVQGRVSSVTILANMDDFDGAVNLFNQYKSNTSFGIHLNLTEGHPLLNNQKLVDYGIYQYDCGKLVMNANPFRYKYIPLSIRNAIYEELDAQIEKVLDAGIQISHIDSHQHIHNGIFILPIVTSLAKKYGIKRIRNIRNYMPVSFNRCSRSAWRLYMKWLYPEAITTDFFTSYKTFVEDRICIPIDCTIELMCHPGGIYPEEESLMVYNDITNGDNNMLINYNQL